MVLTVCIGITSKIGVLYLDGILYIIVPLDTVTKLIPGNIVSMYTGKDDYSSMGMYFYRVQYSI